MSSSPNPWHVSSICLIAWASFCRLPVKIGKWHDNNKSKSQFFKIFIYIRIGGPTCYYHFIYYELLMTFTVNGRIMPKRTNVSYSYSFWWTCSNTCWELDTYSVPLANWHYLRDEILVTAGFWTTTGSTPNLLSLNPERGRRWKNPLSTLGTGLPLLGSNSWRQQARAGRKRRRKEHRN